MKIVIREAKNSDYDKINKIFSDVTKMHKELHPEVAEKFLEEHFDKKYYNECIENSQTVFLVAELDRKVIGFLLATIKQSALREKFVMNISNIAILDDFRNNGVGTQLMEVLSNLAKTKDCARIELNVYNNNETAKSFYKNLGFETQRIVLQKLL